MYRRYFIPPENYVLPAHIKHILFLGGANDIIQMRPQKFILEDLDKTLRYCQSKNFDLGIVLPLVTAESRLNEYILPLRDVISARFAERTLLLDLQPAVGLTAAELKDAYLDGVHPTAAVYRAMGTYAAPLLKNWLEKIIVNKETLLSLVFCIIIKK